jgi:hypothetical protein
MKILILWPCWCHCAGLDSLTHQMGMGSSFLFLEKSGIMQHPAQRSQGIALSMSVVIGT